MLSKFFKPILLQRPFCMIAGGILGGLLLTQACVYEDMGQFSWAVCSQNLRAVGKRHWYDP